MSAARRSWALVLLAAPLLLVACAPGPAAAPSSPPSTTPTSAAPAASDAPPQEDQWQRFSTIDGMASVAVPPTWTVEGGASSSELGETQWLWIRNASGQEMAVLGIGTGDGRGGYCDDWDGDGSSFVPARIHLVEEVDVTGDSLDDGPPAYLSAATVGTGEDTFALRVGYTAERPEGDRMPCPLWNDVAVPDGYPVVELGSPGPEMGEGMWSVDSFEAGERYTETEEYATLIDVLRSLQLEAGS